MNMELLRQAPIFDGISDTDLEHLVNCLNPTVQSCSKNELIYPAGEKTTRIAIILSGTVRIFTEDYFGNTNIMATLGQGEIFGDICAGIEKSEITVRAAGPLQIMFIEYFKTVDICRSACEYHKRILINLIMVLADRNRNLSEKLQIMQKRTIREKLLAYLYIHAKKAASPKFNIPLNRAELAEYLRVDRSAMSRELCLMRDEGILEFYKSSFVLTGEDSN